MIVYEINIDERGWRSSNEGAVKAAMRREFSSTFEIMRRLKKGEEIKTSFAVYRIKPKERTTK